MQDTEHIPDAFFREQLEEFMPSQQLLHSSYSIFITERSKKKKRYFFWLFFSLLLTVSIPVYIYFTPVHSASGGRAALPLTGIQQASRHTIIQAPSVNNIFVYDSIFSSPKNISSTEVTSVPKPGIDTVAAITVKRTDLINVTRDSVLKNKGTAPVDTFYIVW